MVEDWRIEDNTVRPHSALGYLTPTDYAKTWTATHPALSYGWTINRDARIDRQVAWRASKSATRAW